MGEVVAPQWLVVESALGSLPFSKTPSTSSLPIVRDAIGADDPHHHMQRAAILGSETFLEKMLARVESQPLGPEIVRKEKPVPMLAAISVRSEEPRFGHPPGVSLRGMDDHGDRLIVRAPSSNGESNRRRVFRLRPPEWKMGQYTKQDPTLGVHEWLGV